MRGNSCVERDQGLATRFKIGTRKSAMALAQTEEIARRLTAAMPDLDVEIVKFDTTGDRDQTSKLLPHGGKGGAFVAQIRAAVLSGELQAAMHSLKDMPGNEDTPVLVIGATLERDPPTDVLVLRQGISFDNLELQRLPDGGAVGPADALIMARAGLERVGLAGRIAHEFLVGEMLPAA